PPLSQGSRALYIYDPATDTWSRGADAPFIFAAAGRAVLDGQLYVAGGCSNHCFLDAVHRYDPPTATWQPLARYPVAASPRGSVPPGVRRDRGAGVLRWRYPRR